MDFIVGTAGHIDHGKTQLVKALTGTDTDRLPEERSRGITIDLGFAELAVGDIHFGFVDVPGHERFVKNMLAGASGIDLALLVVAANEGIMPQTREHFDICRLLNIGGGVVAITKSDLADDELIDLVRLEVDELVKGSFLENAPVVAVSAKSGKGLDELKSKLVAAARSVRARSDYVVTRLAVDRSFAVKGFGTVVTGTLASGNISVGDELDLLPRGKTVRVRGVQSHGAKVDHTAAGRRTALNLAGIDHFQVGRGMLLAEKGVLRPSQIFDAIVEVLPDASKPLRTRQRVRLHIGTSEVLARIVVLGEDAEIMPGRRGFVQLRLESPVAAIFGERFILRSYSPQITIAGGAILRPATERIRRRGSDNHVHFLRALSDADGDHAAVIKLLVDHSGRHAAKRSKIRSITGWHDRVVNAAAQALIADGQVIAAEDSLISRSIFDELSSEVLTELSRFQKAEPLARGLSLENLRDTMFRFLPPEIEHSILGHLTSAGKIMVSSEVVTLAGRKSELSPAESDALDRLRKTFADAGLEVPKLNAALAEVSQACGIDIRQARKLFQVLIDSAEVVQVTTEFYFSNTAIDDLIKRLRDEASSSVREIDVPKFKEIAGISRKFAIPLLEYFDQRKITARRGDKRLII